VSRLSTRARLTAAFAAATLLMLVGASWFVYARLRADLDDRIDALLSARSAAAGELALGAGLGGVAIEDPEESFVQLLDADGVLLDHGGGGRAAAVGGVVVAGATAEGSIVEDEVAGIDGRARLLVRRLDHGHVLIVGESLRDREEALGSVVDSFAVGGATALVLAALVGSLLARAGLRPVEAMRRRAAAISLYQADEGLPLPAAEDEIRRLGVTLNEMLARMRASYEREARFVSDASHELRTPIAVVKTELDGALRAGDFGSRTRDALLAAVEECDRLAQLAEDLLVLAKADGGRIPLRPEQVDLGELLVRVRDRFADRAAERARSINLELDGKGVMVADPERIRQALHNLVENALRHGTGTITLRALVGPDGVVLEVSDEGRDLPVEFAPLAFERFTRVDRTRDGAGLGLAIVAAIAAAHGGRADIDTPPTTARMRLPSVTTS
jgi:two-component system, OmpR family, sensor kinase